MQSLNQRWTLTVAMLAWLFASRAPAQDTPAPAAAASSPAAWLDDPAVFPLAVWLQDPANAPRYRAAGFNLYVGLWEGPTEKQLADLAAADMHVICDQNAVGLQHKDDPAIVAWMHGDEPDNAQEKPGGGYGPPINARRVIANYHRIKAADPSRPVLLNLGQGVAWDGWYGRGERSNHPEDYLQYVQACDIASFDIYPASHYDAAVIGKLWFVADGVTRLRQWAGPQRRVWNCIECTNINGRENTATPLQVRAEVWMSLIRGSQGLIYFVHVFKPRFIEAGLLADPAMLAEVSALNHRITELAPVLHRPSLSDTVTVQSQNADAPVEAMVKRHAGALYVFSVAMRAASTTAHFNLADRKLAATLENATVEVLGEDRTLTVHQGRFADTFAPWAVHLYRIAEP